MCKTHSSSHSSVTLVTRPMTLRPGTHKIYLLLSVSLFIMPFVLFMLLLIMIIIHYNIFIIIVVIIYYNIFIIVVVIVY